MRLKHHARRAVAATLILTTMAAAPAGCSVLGEPLGQDTTQAPSAPAVSMPSTPPKPSSTPSASPFTPTPTPTPVPLIIPGCDSMNPLAQQQNAAVTLELLPPGPVDLTFFDQFAGPMARETMRQVDGVEGCRWPLEFHWSIQQYIAVLPAER